MRSERVREMAGSADREGPTVYSWLLVVFTSLAFVFPLKQQLRR